MREAANTVVMANHMDSLLADDEFFSKDSPLRSPLDRTDSFFRQQSDDDGESDQSEDDKGDCKGDSESVTSTDSVRSRDSVAWLFQN